MEKHRHQHLLDWHLPDEFLILNHLGQLNLWLIVNGVLYFGFFIQSVLFVFIDIDKDKQYGHQTLALALIPDKLFQLTQNLGLLLAFILLSVTFLGKLIFFGFLFEYLLTISLLF